MRQRTGLKPLGRQSGSELLVLTVRSNPNFFNLTEKFTVMIFPVLFTNNSILIFGKNAPKKGNFTPLLGNKRKLKLKKTSA